MTVSPAQSFDDIIFEQRNQAYGAYQLRKNQGKNLFMAMGILYGSILIGFGIYHSTSFYQKPESATVKEADKETEEELVEVILPSANNSSYGSKSSSNARLTAKVTMEDQSLKFESSTASYSDDNSMIEDTDSEDNGLPNGDKGSANRNSIIGEDENENKEQPIQIIEYASFPGGPAMMEKYIKDNYKFPQEAIKDGNQGELIIYFEINKLGKVENVKIKQTFPSAEKFEEEAIKVISSMPDWVPEKVNGRPVKARREIKLNCKL